MLAINANGGNNSRETEAKVNKMEILVLKRQCQYFFKTALNGFSSNMKIEVMNIR